jgi:hypothetical protein
MGGEKTDQEKLNHTLESVVKILHEEGVTDWFIFYGTLLGIVREDSCIAGDDDIDIMINYDFKQLLSIFEKRGFTFKPIENKLLKSSPTKEFASFDFYFCEVDEEKKWLMRWVNNSSTIVTNPYIDSSSKTFHSITWRSTILNLPNNYMDKIIKMYGETWNKPQSNTALFRNRSI